MFLYRYEFYRNAIASAALVFACSACSMLHMPVAKETPVAPAPAAPVAKTSADPVVQKHYDEVASGKVVKLGDKELILDEGKDFLFVDLDARDKERLQGLKAGDKITILGKKSMANGKIGDQSTEIDEIMMEDGKHVPLN